MVLVPGVRILRVTFDEGMGIASKSGDPSPPSSKGFGGLAHADDLGD